MVVQKNKMLKMKNRYRECKLLFEQKQTNLKEFPGTEKRDGKRNFCRNGKLDNE